MRHGRAGSATTPLKRQPEGWLNKIAFHIASHYHEKRARRPAEKNELPETADPSPGADVQIEREERWLQVLALLQELPEGGRAVLVAHDIDGMPVAEIAAQLGISESTACKWRISPLCRLRELAEERRKKKSYPPLNRSTRPGAGGRR